MTAWTEWWASIKAAGPATVVRFPHRVCGQLGGRKCHEAMVLGRDARQKYHVAIRVLHHPSLPELWVVKL